MRDILVTLLVFGSLPFILRQSYYGVLVWSWLSYMNPHRLAWGFAYNMPFAQIVALTLMVSLFFSRDKKTIPLSGTLVVWVAFLLWMVVTTALAVNQAAAIDYYVRIIKIQIPIFLTLMLMTNFVRINHLIWVIVVSIGYFSVKGGVFTILTGGVHRVWGPAHSFISENNALALSTLMIVPLMVYLYSTSKNKWVRYGLIFSIVMSLASSLGSQSRGALLAAITVGGFFWLKSNSKLVTGIAIALLATLSFTFMPAVWHDRMDTIRNYEQDASAMGRINAWTYSINIANDRFTGGGLQSWSAGTFALYAPDPQNVKVAHSIYFNVLADHGWVGLVLFLLILFLTWRNLSRVIKLTKNRSEHYAENMLARMLQVGLVAYMSGGAFLSLSYFDLPWHFFAIAMLLKTQLKVDAAEEIASRPPFHFSRRAGSAR